jgi:hypothetical protein
MVHLVLAALGAVAVETQSLVGHELLGARVEGGAKGNTALIWLAREAERVGAIAKVGCGRRKSEGRGI